MVTHPTTNLPACGLSTAERTGSPVLHTLWSYVLDLYMSRYISHCRDKNEALIRAYQEYSKKWSKIILTLSQVCLMPTSRTLPASNLHVRTCNYDLALRHSILL